MLQNQIKEINNDGQYMNPNSVGVSAMQMMNKRKQKQNEVPTQNVNTTNLPDALVPANQRSAGPNIRRKTHLEIGKKNYKHLDLKGNQVQLLPVYQNSADVHTPGMVGTLSASTLKLTAQNYSNEDTYGDYNNGLIPQNKYKKLASNYQSETNTPSQFPMENQS